SASAASPLPVSYPNTLCGAPQAVSGCPAPAGFASSKPTILLFAGNYQQPYVEQYNLAVEYEVAKDTSLRLGYTGVHGVHLQRTRDINQIGPEIPAVATVAGGGTLNYTKF